MVAPLFDEKEYMTVYLPGKTEWTHLWTGTTYKVSSEGLLLNNFPVMYGQPAVFYRDTAE
jgi:alpha-glucosidase (family GH31 glycosyl hydrolase)